MLITPLITLSRCELLMDLHVTGVYSKSPPELHSPFCNELRFGLMDLDSLYFLLNSLLKRTHPECLMETMKIVNAALDVTRVQNISS
ncbi:hypothetical protein GDO81_019476 [Engystomops pustulosus]|uniref:Uncharacterized protein n=1 Tax=Engystomops pustulosus TaxID=76066 RepID=A0AAV6YW36_ENGPU|nr:hypothetical protein GDO81_019476 [Engystomops pustulosus]